MLLLPPLRRRAASACLCNAFLSVPRNVVVAVLVLENIVLLLDVNVLVKLFVYCILVFILLFILVLLLLLLGL